MLEVFAQNLVSFVFSILVLVATPFILLGLKKVLAMLNINLGNAQDELIRGQIRNLLLATEEWAQSRVKASIPTNANDKAQQFIASAMDRIPGITAEEAFQFSQEELPKLMLGAAGALGKLTTSVGK